MDAVLKPAEVHRLATLELNLFNLAHTLHGVTLEGVMIDPGTPIHDPNGEVLFYRIGLKKGAAGAGYADIAAHSLFGESLLATAPGATWNSNALLAQARTALRKLPHAPAYDDVRFVAFSYPKIAVQFLAGGREVAMLELGTWNAVPAASRDRNPMEPGNFDRYSLIDETPAERKQEAHKRFEDRVNRLSRVVLPAEAATSVISRVAISPAIGVLSLYDTEELHYNKQSSSHHTCYELHGQETSVWCVAASVQMVLDFYRYNYTQSRIAQQLGLGTLAHPNGLPYSRDNDVAVALHAMSNNALTAAMLTAPPFSTYVSEIQANRPMVSFVPGHSRSVAGYTRANFVILGHTGFQGLLVYDPWPPNSGVITRWENFNTHTYRRAFTARVTTI